MTKLTTLGNEVRSDENERNVTIEAAETERHQRADTAGNSHRIHGLESLASRVSSMSKRESFCVPRGMSTTLVLGQAET